MTISTIACSPPASAAFHVTLEQRRKRFLVLPLGMLRCEHPDAVQREEELKIHRLLAPECAVVVERGDALGDRHEIRRAVPWWPFRRTRRWTSFRGLVPGEGKRLGGGEPTPSDRSAAAKTTLPNVQVSTFALFSWLCLVLISNGTGGRRGYREPFSVLASSLLCECCCSTFPRFRWRSRGRPAPSGKDQPARFTIEPIVQLPVGRGMLNAFLARVAPVPTGISGISRS